MYFTKKYRNIISQNFLITNTADVAWSKKKNSNYCLHSTGLEQFIAIQSQFFYLLLTTKTIPFLPKKYPMRKKFHFGAVCHDTLKITAYPKQINLESFLAYFMKYLMKDQLPPEQSVIKFDINFIKVIIWNSPLDEQTNCLLTTETSFINDIPIYLKFITKYNLRQEIAFWIFFHQFLRTNDSSSIREFNMKKYKYLDI